MKLAPAPLAFRTKISTACRSASPVSPLQNDLLALLPADVQQRLYPLLELYPLRHGMVLCESGDTLSHAYFPTDAIASKLYVTRDGGSAEIAIVGKDGFVGVAQLMRSDSTPWRTVVKCPGNSYRLPIHVLRDEFDRHGELLSVMLRYSQTLFMQIAQTAVCNRHHTVKQQLCRWLLQSIDRLPDDNVHVTQELIANTLGVRREGVTEAAGKLQKLGMITYKRGHIRVLDRPGLERLSCECYLVVRSEKERLMNCRSKYLQYGS